MKTKQEIDVLVVGELNVDIILNQVEQLPVIGKEILAEEMNVTLGSSSAIFAANLSTLGTRVAFAGKTGTDSFADLIDTRLRESNVDTAGIVRTTEFKTGATIVLNFDQDRAMVTYPGAMAELVIEDIDLDKYEGVRHLHLSSVFLQPGIRQRLPELFANAKKRGLTTSLDPQWDPAEKWDLDLATLLPLVDVFMPNSTELRLLTKADSLGEGIQMIAELAPEITLVVKDGTNGAYTWSADDILHQPAILNTNVVDCIGAGDSFNAGFIHQFVKGRSLAECMQYGALTGAVSTTRAGGTGAFASLDGFKTIAWEQFSIHI